MSGKSREYLPFIATPVAANAEVFMDRIRGVALKTAAFSCDRENKKGTVADIYLTLVAK